MQTTFEKEIYRGLTANPKFLSSKYFYDKQGDALFQKIMQLPEYYLSRVETGIFEHYKSEICAALATEEQVFDLVELGAGDGSKTQILLKELLKQGKKFTYIPIDISENVLQQLKNSLLSVMPKLKIKPTQGTYFDILETLGKLNKVKKVIFFLGSNLGNLLHPKAIVFLRNLSNAMATNDLLFMGLDQKKDPAQILDAYNDKTGVTAAFNKNILSRINRELGGDFNTALFKHWEAYDPETGTARSFLVAVKDHTVNVEGLKIAVHFKKWETIHAEISQKYDDETVDWLAREANLKVLSHFTDLDNAFTNYLFKKTYESNLEQ